MSRHSRSHRGDDAERDRPGAQGVRTGERCSDAGRGGQPRHRIRAMTARIAVLASGGGTNLQSILDYLAARGATRAGDVVLVASDNPNAGALDRARRAGVPAAVLKSGRAPEGCEAFRLLREHPVDLITRPGFLHLVPQ